MFMGCVV